MESFPESNQRCHHIKNISKKFIANAEQFLIRSQMSENLIPLLDKSECYCLNEDISSPFVNLFQDHKELVLLSNADEQLVLQLTFNQTVSLHCLVFGIPEDNRCPRTIKLFLNKKNLGFDEASGNYDFSFLEFIFALFSVGFFYLMISNHFLLFQTTKHFLLDEFISFVLLKEFTVR
jgi:hypothetical protein